MNLTTSSRYDDLHASLTVAVTVEGDRAMVTHGYELPESLPSYILATPTSRTVVVNLGGEADRWNESRSCGTILFADIGFDISGRQDPADLRPLWHYRTFVPSTARAMAYTQMSSPNLVVRKLAEHVPLAAVTNGIGEVYAIDRDTDKEE